MKDLFRKSVVTTSLMAVGAVGAWIHLRPRIPRAESFTDGVEQVSPRRLQDEMRLALWQEAQPLEPQLRSGAPAPRCVGARVFAVSRRSGAQGGSAPRLGAKGHAIVFGR